ncbi:MAG: type II secretion system protein N [Candidatus Babeliaceae bacterium]
MKSPLWILNSALVLLFFIIIFTVFLFNQEIPHRTSLSFTITPLIPQDISQINIARIYENDLFNTFIKPVAPAVPERVIPTIPTPPAQLPSLPAPPFKPQFLPPLDITLKGIMYSHNDADKQVIIANNKTQQEALYKLGDKIDDAELISIGKNKIILVRSNGQQETIFISADDAQKDPLYGQSKSWSSVIKKESETDYIIDPSALIKRVTSLAQFIDMLDLTTAFEEGRTLGCKVGKMTSKSIGPSLGLRFGDIITAINDIPTFTPQQRTFIFESIKNLPVGSTIKVELNRFNQPQTLSFKLQKIENENEEEPLVLGSQAMASSQEVSQKNTSDNDTNMLMREMKRKDQHAMLYQGGQDAFLPRASY